MIALKIILALLADFLLGIGIGKFKKGGKNKWDFLLQN